MWKLWTIFVIALHVSLVMIDGKSLEISSYARVARNGGNASSPSNNYTATEPKPATDQHQQQQHLPEMYLHNFEIRNQFPCSHSSGNYLQRSLQQNGDFNAGNKGGRC